MLSPLTRQIVRRQRGRCLDCTRAFGRKLQPVFSQEEGSEIVARCPQCHLAHTRNGDKGEEAWRADQHIKVKRDAPPRIRAAKPTTAKPDLTGWEAVWKEGHWGVRRREK